MFAMTQSAGAQLAHILQTKSAPQESAVRIARTPEGLALAVDQIRAGDHGFQHEDRIVLVVSEDVSEVLSDKVLRCHDTDQGPKLVIQDREAVT
jgi:hypothetical protein